MHPNGMLEGMKRAKCQAARTEGIRRLDRCDDFAKSLVRWSKSLVMSRGLMNPGRSLKTLGVCSTQSVELFRPSQSWHSGSKQSNMSGTAWAATPADF